MAVGAQVGSLFWRLSINDAGFQRSVATSRKGIDELWSSIVGVEKATTRLGQIREFINFGDMSKMTRLLMGGGALMGLNMAARRLTAGIDSATDAMRKLEAGSITATDAIAQTLDAATPFFGLGQALREGSIELAGMAQRWLGLGDSIMSARQELEKINQFNESENQRMDKLNADRIKAKSVREQVADLGTSFVRGLKALEPGLDQERSKASQQLRDDLKRIQKAREEADKITTSPDDAIYQQLNDMEYRARAIFDMKIRALEDKRRKDQEEKEKDAQDKFAARLKEVESDLALSAKREADAISNLFEFTATPYESAAERIRDEARTLKETLSEFNMLSTETVKEIDLATAGKLNELMKAQEKPVTVTFTGIADMWSKMQQQVFSGGTKQDRAALETAINTKNQLAKQDTTNKIMAEIAKTISTVGTLKP